MIRDNGVCGTGVAFNTRVGGQLYIHGMRILKDEILWLSWIQSFLRETLKLWHFQWQHGIMFANSGVIKKISILKYVRRSLVSL